MIPHHEPPPLESCRLESRCPLICNTHASHHLIDYTVRRRQHPQGRDTQASARRVRSAPRRGNSLETLAASVREARVMELRAPVGADADVKVPLQLAGTAVRHPWLVLAIWLIAILLGAVGAHRLPQVTVGVEGGVPGSPSRRAAEALRSEFNNPFIDPLVIAASAPNLK